jgi:hypothetical protein
MCWPLASPWSAAARIHLTASASSRGTPRLRHRHDRVRRLSVHEPRTTRQGLRQLGRNGRSCVDRFWSREPLRRQCAAHVRRRTVERTEHRAGKRWRQGDANRSTGWVGRGRDEHGSRGTPRYARADQAGHWPADGEPLRSGRAWILPLARQGEANRTGLQVDCHEISGVGIQPQNSSLAPGFGLQLSHLYNGPAADQMPQSIAGAGGIQPAYVAKTGQTCSKANVREFLPGRQLLGRP